MDIAQIIKIAWPIIVLQFGLQIYAIIDVVKRKKTKNFSPIIWILIILVGEIVGPILYLLLGRSEE